MWKVGNPNIEKLRVKPMVTTILVCPSCGINYDSTTKHTCSTKTKPCPCCGLTPAKVLELVEVVRATKETIAFLHSWCDLINKALAALEENP